MADEATPNTPSPSDDQSGIEGIPPSGSAAPTDIERPKINKLSTGILGASLIILMIFSCYWLYVLWPSLKTDPATGNPLPGWELYVTEEGNEIGSEQRMLLLVMLAGMIGSLIHAGTSFSNYVGEQKLDKNWIWWYALRPLIGVAVALVFYLVFRAGLVTSSSVENLNIYGVMSLAALSGLFTDRATLKLKEVFETIFKPNDVRSGALQQNTEISGDDGAKA